MEPVGIAGLALFSLAGWTAAAYAWGQLAQARERVEDARWAAELHRRDEAPRPATVDERGTPDARGHRALRELEEDAIFGRLEEIAREEGRDVSESRLREEARRIRKELGISGGRGL